MSSFLRALVPALCVIALAGCNEKVTESRAATYENACLYSGGVFVEGACHCSEQVCADGVLCMGDGNACAVSDSCQPAVIPGDEALSLWTEEAPARKALIEYMAAITKEGSQDYIPVDDRIAVFDLDGTLFCETDPNYLDYNVFVHRVLEDPDYKDKATDTQKDVANKILEVNETGVVPAGLDVAHQIAYMEAFAGMTLPEFEAYLQAFMAEPAPSYDGMTRGDAFYKPMLQVVDYLLANQFTVYVVSGTDRLQVRVAIAGKINIPARQVIGSDGTIVATGQDKTDDLVYDNLNYVYKPDDTLVRGGGFIVKNLKMNKVAVIAQEIGKQPVLGFGNSSGDSSMLEYVITGNRYKSASFMLMADDLVRENGSMKKAENVQTLCNKYGWIPVSMRDDWKTIYGDGVTRKAAE